MSLTPKQKLPRKRFSYAEDVMLRKIIDEWSGAIDWKVVAETLGNGRDARQCRERYRNYLSPKVKNTAWTAEEEALLEEKFLIYGPKWAKMTQFFTGRTDVNLKNHWVLMLTRKSKIEFENQRQNQQNPTNNFDAQKSEFSQTDITDISFERVLNRSKAQKVETNIDMQKEEDFISDNEIIVDFDFSGFVPCIEQPNDPFVWGSELFFINDFKFE